MNGKITERIPYGFMRHEKYDVMVMDSEKMESAKLMFNYRNHRKSLRYIAIM